MLTKEFLGTYYKLNYKKLLAEARFKSGDRAGMKYEDIVQETFLRCIRFRDHYDTGRPFVPWLSTVMNNVIRDINRQERLKGASYEIQEGDWVTTDSFMFDAEVVRSITEEVNAVQNEEHRNILYLSLIKQMSLKDIEMIVDANSSNIKQIVHRFRNRLKERYY